MARATQNDLGSVVSLWRYPVKSMMGEELNAAEVTDRGLVGDRVYALCDPSNGKVVSAKNPRKWAKLFDFRAALAESPRAGEHIPPVRITLPNG
ncbi:MAG TPA: MOSC N-terminal beta barrel domain-containing protein, partial [Longimicrobiales bacterium]|nr:MOSC N-terminal beta barrel domain-containing protein [Longimicrobiales bacterium]